MLIKGLSLSTVSAFSPCVQELVIGLGVNSSADSKLDLLFSATVTWLVKREASRVIIKYYEGREIRDGFVLEPWDYDEIIIC